MKPPATPPALAPAAADSSDNRKALETRAFFISRISALNALLKRRAAIYAKREFGFTPIEWRIITLLPTLQPISIRELAIEALVDAAQMSRAISLLTDKGFLERERSPDDSREVLISLTKNGLALSLEMCRASLKRNDELLRDNSPKEIQQFNRLLDSLIVRARSLVAEDSVDVAVERAAKPRRKKQPAS